MSRKREKQRDSRRELDRQLETVAPSEDAPDRETLLAHQRVCEPELHPTLTPLPMKRGLLSRAGPWTLHIALYIVDTAGVRLARLLRLEGSAKAGTSVKSTRGDEKVRYARPGRFVLVALLTEGAPAAECDAHAAALGEPSRVRIDGAALDAKSTGTIELGHGISLSIDSAPLTAALLAAAALSIPAVHRVQSEVTLPLASTDGKLAALLSVKVRL